MEHFAQLEQPLAPSTPVLSPAIVVAPAPLDSGGLGTAAAEAREGFAALGCATAFVGPQPHAPLTRVARSRLVRRFFGGAPGARAVARGVRGAVPRGGWELAYAMPGTVPLGVGTGVVVVHQATRHPAVEWEALRQGERETGGRGDLSRAELRRRERELAGADLVHVTSLAVRDELLERGIDPERLVHSYLGVDLERYRPGRKRSRLTVAFIGPLSLRKGVDSVAELAQRVGPEAAVEVVGGPACPWSRRVAERAGFVPRSSARELLAEAQVLVLPSRSDGFSYVVLEALASGTVPIVTPQVGAAEIVRRLDPRLVVERTGFAEAVAALLPRLELAALSRRARALAEEFDRRRTSRAIAAAVLERAGGLGLGAA